MLQRKSSFTKLIKYGIILIVNPIFSFFGRGVLLYTGHQMHPLIEDGKVVLYKKIKIDKFIEQFGLRETVSFIQNKQIVYLKDNKKEIKYCESVRLNSTTKGQIGGRLLLILNNLEGKKETIESVCVIGYVSQIEEME